MLSKALQRPFHNSPTHSTPYSPWGGMRNGYSWRLLKATEGINGAFDGFSNQVATIT